MSAVFPRWSRFLSLAPVVPTDSEGVLPGRLAWWPALFDRSSLQRKLFVALAATALVYAFLAGLRTVKDNDLGWQLATGRWVVQHHQVPPVEAFSYTAQGNWIYPVGAGLLFYAAYLLGGYALISWMGAAACCGTVALLLRRSSPVSAAIAIIAVPLLAWRTAPRADMFTVVLFAAFLSLLWENYANGRAALWLLPILMVAWVNLHLGFSSGLALLAMYCLTELLEAVYGVDRRHAAMHRLRRAAPWLLATVLATLVNPWGWNIYRALLRQERALPQHQVFFQEWRSVPLNWNIIGSALSLRHTGGTIYVILTLAVIAGGIALLGDRLGAGVVLFGATVPAIRYARMGAVFSCLVVVVAGYVISQTMPPLAVWLRSARLRSGLAIALTALLALLTAVRCIDLVTNRYYFLGTEESNFGAGLGWWFPQRAADFIERQQLPGEVFNTYSQGGYLSFRLGPQRRDYIDGRGIPFGVERIEREARLRQTPPDSPLWEQEVSRYNINTVILPIARYQGIRFVRLQDFCSSKIWSLVYMDEISAVFVRRTPETESLVRRFPLNCATAPLPAQPPPNGGTEAFNTWANASAVLAALGREAEALIATQKGLAIFPQSAFLHMIRADALFASGRFNDSEREYFAAAATDPSEAAWDALAQSYRKRGRIADAIGAEQHAANLSLKPWSTWLDVGYLYLDLGQPESALTAFDKAGQSIPESARASDQGEFVFMMAQGRARAWDAAGDLAKATAYQEQAAKVKDDAPQPWQQLAIFYQRAGRMAEAERARQHAASLAAKGNHAEREMN